MGKISEAIGKNEIEERFDFKHFAKFSAAAANFFNQAEKYVKDNPKGVANTTDDDLGQLRDDWRKVEDKVEKLAKFLK